MNYAERERERVFLAKPLMGVEHSASCARHREFNHQSARVAVHQMGDDVWSVRYSGVICEDSFSLLRGNVIGATGGATAMLLRMDAALTLLTPPIPNGTYTANRAPGVIVVRSDQYQVWAEYARQMAKHGVIRAVVLQDELAQAHRLMDCFAGLTPREKHAAH